jgi:hypothetical protein
MNKTELESLIEEVGVEAQTLSLFAQVLPQDTTPSLALLLKNSSDRLRSMQAEMKDALNGDA